MDKRRAIQIMTKAAQLYKENLEDQKVLFLYGLPREVKKQLQEKGKILSSVQGYVLFVELYRIVFQERFYRLYKAMRLLFIDTIFCI